MLTFPHRTAVRRSQGGGITILVALMMLVFITIAALGMSRNSFREIIVSGSTRQGAMVRNVADSGIEYSIFWMEPSNRTLAAAGTTAASMNALKAALIADDTLSGRPYNVNEAGTVLYNTAHPPAPFADLDLTAPGAAFSIGASLALTRMGKLPIADISQGVGSGAYAPATGNPSKQAPDLWAVRSDAQLGGTFFHAKEAWISTPVQ